MRQERDHGGGLDAAIDQYGSVRADWLDLSTGINPQPYPIPPVLSQAWTALPDRNMADDLVAAARAFWNVPADAAILAAPGASSLIAQIPRLATPGRVDIPPPTYNEHAASFAALGWRNDAQIAPDARVLVHPNNPDGKLWHASDITAKLTVIDESFCDVMPDRSLIAHAGKPGTIVLKSFGKFWGLAGLRLGFAIGDPRLIDALKDMLGPWPVSGVALQVGAAALSDDAWAQTTRIRLRNDADRLDSLFTAKGADLIGGTTLFRLYRVDDANAWQARLAHHRIWTRTFPYAADWIRIGMPSTTGWAQLEGAL